MTMITISGLHLEPTNICTLGCLGCARTRFRQQWPTRWKNHSLDPTILETFLDLELTNVRVQLGGNYGDPIYHPDLLALICMLKTKGCYIGIMTNGSHRSKIWWQDLVGVLDKNDQITFAIDGLPESNHLYRTNSNWQSIQTAIEVCQNRSFEISWKFIPFAYNQDQINDAQNLAHSMGMTFKIEHSDRWDEQTIHLAPKKTLMVEKNRQTFDTEQTKNKISPKCYDDTRHFITADGFYAPCCFMADHRFYYKTEFGNKKSSYDIRNHTMSQILSRPTVIEFYKTLPVQSLPVCDWTCGIDN